MSEAKAQGHCEKCCQLQGQLDKACAELEAIWQAMTTGPTEDGVSPEYLLSAFRHFEERTRANWRRHQAEGEPSGTGFPEFCMQAPLWALDLARQLLRLRKATEAQIAAEREACANAVEGVASLYPTSVPAICEAARRVRERGAYPPAGVLVLRFRYRNHRGEEGWRSVRPLRLWFGACEWHGAEQWLMDAWDEDRKAERTYALRDILEWGA